MDALNLVEETVDVGGLRLSILRPHEAEELLSEEAFEHEEFLPYWAELWPSGVALAGVVGSRDVGGLRVLELGCGLALPSIVAALAGARVLATDWSEEALEVAAANAARNEAELETALVSWADPATLVGAGPWDLVLGADLLYEQRNVDQLLDLLPRLDAEVLLAEPGRPPARRFFELARERFRIATVAERVHRLSSG